MLTNQARARANALLTAVASILSRLGLSPDALTIAGFFGMCLSGVVIAAGYEALGGLLIILAGGFDAVDGTLARMTGRASKFGAFLDSTLDRWAEGAIFLGIVYRASALHEDLTIYLAVSALVGSLLVSYTRARAEGLGASLRGGWFSRFERMIVLVAGLILTAWAGPIALTVSMAVLALFSNLTALQRVLAARQVLH